MDNAEMGRHALQAVDTTENAQIEFLAARPKTRPDEHRIPADSDLTTSSEEVGNSLIASVLHC